MMPLENPEPCCVCRAVYRLKSLRRVRHTYGKRTIYNYVCAACAENVARARTQEEEEKGV
jgi:hypothetical protein